MWAVGATTVRAHERAAELEHQGTRAIGFLCTPGASYVTGQCLVVDGGSSIAEERG